MLAHTYTGDIRLIVRESGDVNDDTGSDVSDEDLELSDNGSARFAESNLRLPAVQTDGPRTIGHGTIFAEATSPWGLTSQKRFDSIYQTGT